MGNNNFERVKSLLRQYRNLESIMGYHSTSVEAVFILAQTGRLLGYDEKHHSKSDRGASTPNYLYFTPIRDMFKGTPFYGALPQLREDIFWTVPPSHISSTSLTNRSPYYFYHHSKALPALAPYF